jgi:hypothetical protein
VGDTPNANIPVWWVLMRDLIVASFFSLRMKLQGTFFSKYPILKLFAFLQIDDVKQEKMCRLSSKWIAFRHISP